jgi:hypothetical protein
MILTNMNQMIVCNEILEISKKYVLHVNNNGVSYPSELSSISDMWKMILRWNTMLNQPILKSSNGV